MQQCRLSYTKMIAAAGAEPGLKVLGARVCEPEEAVAERLALPAGAEVLRVERVRTADGRAVVYSIDQIPNELVDGIDADRLEPSLHTVLARPWPRGAQGATARLVPVVASARLAKDARRAASTPLQHFDQTDYDGSGRAVMVWWEWHTSDPSSFASTAAFDSATMTEIRHSADDSATAAAWCSSQADCMTGVGQSRDGPTLTGRLATTVLKDGSNRTVRAHHPRRSTGQVSSTTP